MPRPIPETQPPLGAPPQTSLRSLGLVLSGVFLPAPGRALRRASDRREARVSQLLAGSPSASGRSPGAARVRGSEPRPQAPHPAPPLQRLARAPLGERDDRDYNPNRNFVKRSVSVGGFGPVATILAGDLFPANCDAVAGRPLYHRCLLVYGLDDVRSPAVAIACALTRYLFGNSSGRSAGFYCRRIVRRACRHAFHRPFAARPDPLPGNVRLRSFPEGRLPTKHDP